MPACATPVAEGMKVSTRSEYAKEAQRGVMEFLLINHPLDCPICDQGGECQLQDLAVGYGGSSSRYAEPKRVVLAKPMGPLISAEEMTRCIHCTRCVRFGQEIAGVMELGMIGRGEHAEIVSFVGRAVDSELSGNMIDICPVGALTSKPFRYTARTWELGRRRSVSPHDGLGSNLIVQVKDDQVMRVVPFEKPELNECWLSDKDRFSYEGLNADGPPDDADGEAGRRMARGRLGEGARARGRRPAPGDGVARRGGDRRARVAARDARGDASRAEARARPRQRERRLPPAPDRLRDRRQAAGRAVARHAGGRARGARPRARRGHVPAQGPSAHRPPPAAGGEARPAGERDPRRRRRSRDQARARARRAAGRAGAGARAGGEGGRRGEGRRGAARARRGRGRRGGARDRQEPRFRAERRDLPRQQRAAAPAREPAARARPGARASARRAARLPRRGREQRRRAPRALRARRGRAERRGDARRPAEGVPAARRRARARRRQSAPGGAARWTRRSSSSRSPRTRGARRITPTCCCRWRRSPRPPAPS